jgi:hypothetical protein
VGPDRNDPDRREALEAALWSRLERAVELNDFTLLLESGAAQEARSLAALLGEDEDLQALLLLGWVHWYRARALPDDQKQRDVENASALFVHCVLIGADFQFLPEEVVPSIAGTLAPVAKRLLLEALRGPDLQELTSRLDLSRRILAAIPMDHPDRIEELLVVCYGMYARFQRTEAAEDLDETVRAARDAVAEIPADRSERYMMLGVLRTVLQLRIQRIGMPADLDEAVEVGQEILAAAPAEERAQELSNLGLALNGRFIGVGNVADLEEAVRVTREAVTLLAAGHPDRPSALSNLGGTLSTLFERTGNMSDIDDAVEAGHEAVATTSPSDPELSARLSNYGTALRVRFARTGNAADLDEAIDVLRRAITSAQADFPGRTTVLSNLGVALQARYKRTGAMTDLDDAVRACREAVELTPPGDPERVRWLSNLAIALESQFQRTGVLSALEDAIQAGRDAVAEASSHHADRGRIISNLGADLQSRYRQTGVQADLDESIAYLEQAVAAADPDAPERLRWLSNLGTALQLRFEETGMPGDLDEAVRAGEEAVANTPADHAERAGRLSNLGRGLGARFEFTGAQEDLRAAINAYEASVGTVSAPASVRIRAARAGAALAADRHPALAAELLETAVRLLPEVAPRELERHDQQYALGGLSGLAADAAALALSVPGGSPADRASLALRLLEAGRSVMLSQALEVRNDLTDLTHRHPALAERFIRLRDLLENVSGSAEQVTSDRRRLATELTELLGEIRCQDGFGSFTLPPAATELMRQADQGPVAVLNVSEYRADALLLTEGGIVDLPLPGLEYDIVVERIMEFRRALRIAHEGTTPQERTAAQRIVSSVLEWLWDSAAGPVLDALGLTAEPAQGASPPRMWWATGGVMGLLPLHAAGYHQNAADGTGRRTVMDRVISSYTPTIAALRHARRPLRPATGITAPPALIVAMPTTPGLSHQGRLDFAREEARFLALRFPGAIRLTEPDPDVASPIPEPRAIPSRANVLTYMAKCPIAHFACHGTNDPADPSSSRLLLHDHETAPLTVAALAAVRLDHARLAYLSACETALTTRLLDEGIHLASAFQLAGYRHVIATLWEVNDLIAARIADTFYGSLTPDDADTAGALHQAIRALRDDLPGTPSMWAAHIHAGA